MKKTLLAFFLLWLEGYSRAALPLDPYLLRPEDLPSACQKTAGFYPINEKTDLFYQYQVYRSVLPPATERHAQSLDCQGNKGTLYFFAYATADQAQAAELFANPVLSHTSPAPLFREWPNGFVIVSFSNPPKELLEVLDKKLNTSLIPQRAVLQSTGPVVTMTLPSVSSPTAPVAPSAPPPPQLDIADEVIKNMISKIDCRDSELPEEGKAICGLLRDFRRGDSFIAHISTGEPRIGTTYIVDHDGAIGGPGYQAAIGSGRLGEVRLVALFLGNGVEEFQAQALIEDRQKGRPWPSNEVTAMIDKRLPPTIVSVLKTTGRSLAIASSENRTLFLRRWGHGWIIIGVSGSTPEEQMQTAATVGVLY